MEPIWDKNGSVCGWKDDRDLLDLDGRYRALISDRNIFSYRTGEHIGWYEDGVVWDSGLQAIAFTDDVSTSLSLPGRGGTPGRPGRPGRPGTPGLSGVPGRPGRSNSWSDLTWANWAPPAV